MFLQDGEEKQFIFRHARQIFDLIDEDGSGNNHSSAIKLIIIFVLLNLSGNDFHQKFDSTFLLDNSKSHNSKNWTT